MNEKYKAVFDFFTKEQGYEEVGGVAFYREIFPHNENRGELHEDFSHPNAIYLYHDADWCRLRRRIMLNDEWEADYNSFVKDSELALCSGLVYRKRANKLQNAQQMNALIFDLDEVGDDEIRTIELRWNVEPEHFRSIPRPTFTVLSGTGLHLYYVFDKPIDLYPNIKLQLKQLKYDLTFRIWEYKSTSQEKNIQYQSINQSFRMVGSKNSKGDGEIVRAFRTGGKVSLDWLNRYTEPQNRVDLNRPFKPTQVTLHEAKERYPEWYRRVIVEGQKKPKKWAINEKVHGSDPWALYHWWMKQVPQVLGGHRYYYLMCMAIYACKCDVPKKQLIRDMNEIFDKVAAVQHKNPLTRADMKSALEAYDKEYYDTSIREIEYWAGFQIEKNKRNGRRQNEHLRADYWVNEKGRPSANVCRQNREIALKYMREQGEIKGRPKGSGTAAYFVAEWRSQHPEGRKADCIRETGLSKPTVYKWWEVKEMYYSKYVLKKDMMQLSWEEMQAE